MKEVLKLTYDFDGVSLNEYINIERTDKYRAAKIKQTYTRKYMLFTMSQTKEKLTGRHDIVVNWYNCTKHDPDNIYFGIKFILDGIVASGVLPNDNQTYIRNITNKLVKDKKNWCEVIFLKI